MNILAYISVILFISIGSVFAQNVPGVANGAIAKDSRDEYDNGIRLRSIALEEVKRNANRSAMAEKAAANRKINYTEIKTDFEQIQQLQNEIVKTYITGKQINYGRISTLAEKLKECAARLEKNLLLSAENAKKKSGRKNTEPETVPDTIVILDKTIGNFVTSDVFNNLQVIEPKVAEKAEFELQKIIHLSGYLAQQAEKQK